jgi:fatty acid desaturase
MTQDQSQPYQPANPALRCSDADRERVVADLNKHFTEGRLTLDEFDQRSSSAYQARTYADLAILTADLPGGQVVPAVVREPEPGPAAAQVPQAGRWQAAAGAVGSWLSVSVVLTVIWAVTGADGNFWPGWVIGIWGVFVLMHVLRSVFDQGGRHLDARTQRRAVRDHRRNDRHLGG